MIFETADDLDLEKIALSGQTFRWQRADKGSWRIIAGGECVYATEFDDERYEFECDEQAFDEVWRPYLDLDEIYSDIRGRIDPASDPFLFEASEHEKGIRILRQDPWEMLISFIISQNRNIPAIQKSIELISQAAGTEHVDSRGMRYFGFPAPEQLVSLDEQTLRDCKLGYRARYVHEAARAVTSGELDLAALERADDEAALEMLMGLSGVGIKVASCVLLFGLHRIDAFPIDTWISKVLEDEYPCGFDFERYRPYNGVMQQYLFAYYRNR